MNSKFLTIGGILLAALVVFVVALTHTQNETTAVTPITPDTGASAATVTKEVSQGPATTSASANPPPVRPIQKPAPAPAAARTAVAITIKNYMFGPQTITVKKGTTVTWTNADIARHTVTPDDGSWPSSQFFGQRESYSYTFNKMGTYKYHCEPHPYMTATVIVVE